MAEGLIGNFAGLEQLRQRLERMPVKMLARAGTLVAAGATRLVAQGFQSKKSPYGSSWRPRKRPYPGTLLVRKGNLQSSFRTAIAQTPAAVLVTIATAIKYAGFHQWGTKRMPARPFLPYQQGVIPTSWREMISTSLRAGWNEANRG